MFEFSNQCKQFGDVFKNILLAKLSSDRDTHQVRSEYASSGILLRIKSFKIRLTAIRYRYPHKSTDNLHDKHENCNI